MSEPMIPAPEPAPRLTPEDIDAIARRARQFPGVSAIHPDAVIALCQLARRAELAEARIAKALDILQTSVSAYYPDHEEADAGLTRATTNAAAALRGEDGTP